MCCYSNFSTCMQCINELIYLNLINCFLGFYHDLRHQRFPIYFFRPPLSLPSRFLLFTSYSYLIPLEAKVHYNFSSAQSTFPQYANEHMHLIHRREAEHSIHCLASCPALNSVRFFNRHCSVKDFIEQPQLMYQNSLI